MSISTAPAAGETGAQNAESILARIDLLAAGAREDEVQTRQMTETVNNMVHISADIGPAPVSQVQEVMAEELEQAARQAAVIVEHAVVVAAAGAAMAADNARRARAVAAGMAAEDVAETAALTATAVQSRADSFASMVAGAAADAASTIATLVDADDLVAAATAARVAGIVKATAEASAEETALAAAMVAVAVAAAAAHTASVEASAAVAMEEEVARAAKAVHALATATARKVSDETIARATGVLASSREAAAVVDIGDAMQNVARLLNGKSAAELASKISAISRSLQAEPTPADLIEGIVKAAREHVPGNDWVGIALVSKRGDIRTPARSDEIVRVIDGLQIATKQGPCLSVARDRQTVRVDDLSRDTRWPAFAAQAVEVGVLSMLSFPLFVQEETLGMLNVYSRQANAFSVEAEDIGLLLAAHGALAMVGVEREANLRTALSSRDVIGQAKGILMERQKIGPVAAFQLLVRASQENNRKLTAIAEMVTNTGQELTAKNVREV